MAPYEGVGPDGRAPYEGVGPDGSTRRQGAPQAPPSSDGAPAHAAAETGEATPPARDGEPTQTSLLLTLERNRERRRQVERRIRSLEARLSDCQAKGGRRKPL